VIGRLLHDFNDEYDEPTPPPEQIAARIRELLPRDDFIVLLAGEDSEGIAVLRLRPSIWGEFLECYLAELYVVPPRRGHGLGRALMEAALDIAREAGAGHIELTTSTGDIAARGLYERFGFTNREGDPNGPLMIYYELEL
jgi:GNAT superfamily N-acetyltransferase